MSEWIYVLNDMSKRVKQKDDYDGVRGSSSADCKENKGMAARETDCGPDKLLVFPRFLPRSIWEYSFKPLVKREESDVANEWSDQTYNFRLDQ